MHKPEIITRDDVLFSYYFETLIAEQKKTNELLRQLLGQEVKEDVELSNRQTRRKRQQPNV